MSAVALDVQAVRSRFPALGGPIAFFDGPGGTQVPNSVVDAVAHTLREANANLGGPFPTSRAAELVVEQAHIAAAAFLGCSPDEVGFGQNMTTLNFMLTRTFGRTLQPGDELVVTRLDHDANVAPWLELARDTGAIVRRVDIDERDCSLDLDDLAAQLGPRTRVVAFPWASNAVGTVQDVRRISALAHEAGALAWVDAVHYAPHGPIDVRAVGADVLLCSPYKFFGPHLGLFYGRRELLDSWRPYKVRPAADHPAGARFETGTLSHEALAGCTAAIEYLRSVGWDAIASHERELTSRFLAGLPDGWRLYGSRSTGGRVPTFAITHATRGPDDVAEELGSRGMAVWPGNYYAVEVMERLGLGDGAVRIGFVHYNTHAEVERLLEVLATL